MAKLEHLLIEPINGLCNRIRVLASAKRFSQLTGVPCTILWDWPDYAAIFEPDPLIEIVPHAPVPQHYLHKVAPPDNRVESHLRIPLDDAPRIAITTCHSFGTTADTHYFGLNELLAWLPQPSARVRQAVQDFRAASFPPANIVGMHIRRTDSDVSILESPSWKFVHQARAVIASGGHVYLATDNHRTEQQMQRQLGTNILIYPKNPAIAERWPRKIDPRGADLEETIADYADMLLLASCDFVLGSSDSTFSDLAIALNASSRSCPIKELPLGVMTRDERILARRDALDRAFVRLRQLRRSLQPGIGFGRALGRLGIRVRP